MLKTKWKYANVQLVNILILFPFLLIGCDNIDQNNAKNPTPKGERYITTSHDYVLSSNAYSASVKAANNGDKAAAIAISEHYYSIDQNHNYEGFVWKIRAAELGDASSLYSLGSVSLKTGNCKMALNYITKAVELDYSLKDALKHNLNLDFDRKSDFRPLEILELQKIVK